MRLFRPTGLKELALVRDSDWRIWPPRLPDQPIFYPVTSFEYAAKIARDWNSVLPAPNNFGFVTQFEISERAVERYPVQAAGGKAHTELCVPAEDLDWFNSEIVASIKVLACFKNGEDVSLTEGLACLDRK